MNSKNKIILSMTLFTLLFLILLCLLFTSSIVLKNDLALANEKEKTNSSYQEYTKYIPFPKELKIYEVYPWEMLNLSNFAKSYSALIGSRVKDNWLRLLDGPSSKNKMVTTPQGDFIIVHSCKQHYCDTHFILILFNPANCQSRAMLAENWKIFWLGNPDNEMTLLLKKIGKVTWPNIPSNRFNQ